jgi:Phage tail sheath protein subtilisin-like domain/Phage tail sheath C-terminal domain
MAYQLSPGVNWSEIDLTTIVPSLSTTAGGFAGDFNWGPVNQVFTISNELDLVRYFAKPDGNTFTSFFTAANFLSYGQNLQLVRAADLTKANNATSGFRNVVIPNRDVHEIQFQVGEVSANVGMFTAKYPGELGNSLKVALWASANNDAYSNWEYEGYFNGVPGTSNWTAGLGGANDEMHVVVIDTTAKFSPTPNTVLEKFSYVSKASDAKNDDGSSNYYVNLINQKSEYIYIVNHAINANNVSDTSTWGRPAANLEFVEGQTSYTATLSGGSVGTPREADLINAYDLFDNIDAVDVSLLMTGSASKTVAKHVIDDIAESRRDLVAFVSPPMSAVVNNPGQESSDIVSYTWDPVTGFNPSSYVVMDSGWKKQFDKYNNVYRWVPLNGDTAGLCAYTDRVRDPWWSPAGLNRGLVKNVTQLSWSPNQADRDMLYKNAINPVVTMQGLGTVLYGDKTMTNKPSAFDRINVRRLFIVLEKSISKAAKYSLFEFNDEFTRAQFVALVEPFLRDVKGRRGIYDYKVVCDETNNTPDVIDSNQFVGDIYIKPARAINFIQLNFVAVRTGVAFSEIVGQF